MGNFSGDNGAAFRLDLNLSESYTPAQQAANKSTVNWNLTVVRINSAYYDYNGSANGSWSVNIGGNATSGGWGSYDFRYYSQLQIASGSYEFTHNDKGEGSVSASGSANGNYPIGSADASNSITLTNFDRRPGSASFNTISRTTNSYRVTLNAVSSPAANLYYQTQISINGAAYGDTRSGTDNTFSGLPLNSAFTFAARTGNDDGVTNWVYSGTFNTPNVPGAPGPLTVGPVAGRSTTITTGNATTGSNGTATIASSALTYYVQASPDNGTTWLSAQTMSLVGGVQSYTYTGLNGGATYRFRVYATNEVGTGATTTTTSGTFIPAGGKRYDSTLPTPAFVNANTASRRNEANTAWTPLTITRKYIASQTITNAVGNGSVVTYTARHNLSVGDVVTITGVSPASYNLTSATVASVTRTNEGDSTSGTSFTINSTVTGTYSASTGTAVVGWRDFV